jgi:hypothetical protein
VLRPFALEQLLDLELDVGQGVVVEPGKPLSESELSTRMRLEEVADEVAHRVAAAHLRDGFDKRVNHRGPGKVVGFVV